MACNRIYERFMYSSTVFFLDTITKTENLSMGGMQIKTENSIDRDLISIGMELPEHIFVQLFGEPVWSQDINGTEHIYGIKFVNLTDDVRYLIETSLPLH